MAMIVGVHGIGQQFKGPAVQKDEWQKPLFDGVLMATGRQLQESDLACAFYGDLFRPPGTRGSGCHPTTKATSRTPGNNNSWKPGGARRPWSNRIASKAPRPQPSWDVRHASSSVHSTP